MAAETGFKIDGVVYEPAEIDSLTMDEWQVLYDYAGITIEDFTEPDPDDPEAPTHEEHEETLRRLIRNPGFMRAMTHIAYQRGNPRVSAEKVKKLIGGAQMVDVLETLRPAEPEDGEELPPSSTTEPERSSRDGSVESTPTTGAASETSSDVPAVPPEPIGTNGSDTSGDSARMRSVA